MVIFLRALCGQDSKSDHLYKLLSEAIKVDSHYLVRFIHLSDLKTSAEDCGQRARQDDSLATALS